MTTQIAPCFCVTDCIPDGPCETDTTEPCPACAPLKGGRREPWTVCPDCQGEGTRALHGTALTASDIAEYGEDFMDDYMAGHYDTLCSGCDGRRVVKLSEWQFEAQMEAEYRAESAAYRMGL